MAKAPSRPEPQSAILSSPQKREAIRKIERRIAEVEAFDPNSVLDPRDPRISVIEKKLEEMLASIFGYGTIEYNRYHYQITHLDRTPIVLGRGPSLHQVVEKLNEGKLAILIHLRELVAQFSEDLEDQNLTPETHALRAQEGLELHSEIQQAAGHLFRDGHYANAIEDAVKALNALVRLRSGVDDKDGSHLMEFVFSPGNPVLKFNSLADQSERDEQKGFMMMFSGAVAGLRNPRAHKIIKDEPESALEFIAFISLLAKLVDKARK